MMSITWRILQRGDVPPNAQEISFGCPGCGAEAGLPILGLPIAQIGAGIVFDVGKNAMPVRIQCRSCRRIFGREEN
jgi:hypothetical protein